MDHKKYGIIIIDDDTSLYQDKIICDFELFYFANLGDLLESLFQIDTQQADGQSPNIVDFIRESRISHVFFDEDIPIEPNEIHLKNRYKRLVEYTSHNDINNVFDLLESSSGNDVFHLFNGLINDQLNETKLIGISGNKYNQKYCQNHVNKDGLFAHVVNPNGTIHNIEQLNKFVGAYNNRFEDTIKSLPDNTLEAIVTLLKKEIFGNAESEYSGPPESF